jgi:uncharacterized protein
MDSAIISRIAHDLSLSEFSVEAAVGLLEKGASVSFIARYRKEAIGGTNEARIRAIEERRGYYQEVLDRRAGLLKLAAAQTRLTDDLRQWIEKAVSKIELDDLGQILRPKRRTRASEAQERGLEPLAEYLWNQEQDAWSLEEHADVYINAEKQVASRDQALQGASDIIAEGISENLEIRSRLREMFWKDGLVVSTVVPAKASQKTKYTMYYNRREPAATIPSHRVLAIRRGSKEGVLTSAIECDQTKAIELITSMVIKERESTFASLLERSIRDSYTRILRPLVETQVRGMLKEQADREAIRVFQDNLANLLLTPPAGPMVVLGIDIGKGDEARFAVVDQNGGLLEEAAVRLRPPRARIQPVPAENVPPAVESRDSTAEPAAAQIQATPAQTMPLTQVTQEILDVQPAETPTEGAKPDESAGAPAEETGAAENPAAEFAAPEVHPAEAQPPIEPVVPAAEVEAEAQIEPPQAATDLAEAATPAEPPTSSEPPTSPAVPEEEQSAGQAAPTPENYLETARAILRDLISRHSVRAVSLGNSTAARSLEDLVRQILADEKIEGVLITEVNDAGVAIYSSSRIAREELPEQSVATRCAISLARRLQDPLAELVKVDPKLVGVGQYQHDVDQKELHRSLVQTVRSCVNSVGLDLNTAGFSLLRYASGLNDRLARKIVDARGANPFTSRMSLLQVPGIDAQVFELAAGFLRVRAGDNPLDATAVHPESYPLVEKMAAALAVGIADLIGNKELVSSLKLEDFVTEAAGLPTLHDIREELLRPGRDPRKTFKMARFREDVKQIADLKEGMTLEGTVTNVTNFGAFVDIGVHQDGLVHLSQMSNRFIRDPREAVKVGDVVQVKVISIETETKRIGLSIKALLPPPVRRRKRPRHKGSPSDNPRGAPRKPDAVTAPVQAAAAQDPAPAADAPAPLTPIHPPSRREPRRQDSGRRESGRRDRDRHHSRRREERRPERPTQPQEQAPPEPKVPEPTLQEKIAILQSKFRGIN